MIDDAKLKLKQTAISAVIKNEDDCLDTLLEEVQQPDSVFHDVFSDSSTSESSEE